MGRREVEHDHRLDRLRPGDREAHDRGVRGEIRQGKRHHPARLLEGRLTLTRSLRSHPLPLAGEGEGEGEGEGPHPCPPSRSPNPISVSTTSRSSTIT